MKNMAIKAPAATSISCRAAVVWMHKMMQLFPGDNCRSLEAANRVMKAAEFSANAVLDILLFCSGFMTSAAAAKQTLWLRAWQVDNQAKHIVT